MVLASNSRVTTPSLVSICIEEDRKELWGLDETEEETKLKNHLRWARIRVRGSTNKISTSIRVADENTIFSLPIWMETLATY